MGGRSRNQPVVDIASMAWGLTRFPHIGMMTETRIRTSRPSTSKPSTRVPIPTAARGRSGATGAARVAAAVPGAAAGARSADARSSARATRFRRTSGANHRQSCSNPAPYASRARHLMQCRRYPGKVVKIHSDGTVDVKPVTVWKSRLVYAIDAFPGLPHSVVDVRTGMRTATPTRGSRRST